MGVWMLTVALALAVDAPPEPDPSAAGSAEEPKGPAELRAAIRERLVAEEIPAEMLDGMVEQVAADVEFEQHLKWVTGDVEIQDGLAVLHLGDQWQFVGPEAAADIVERWGNPRPALLPVGMLSPVGMTMLSADGWGVLVTWSEEGHVSDADAADMDFDALLTQMQEGTAASAEARKAAGYEALELVGWAEPPHYDAVNKRLYWARHLRAGTGESLNYDIRALGRRGVLELSAVAPMEMLPQVKAPMEDLLGRIEFRDGHRYADFDPDLDTVAAYGIGGLIAGKMAMKAGFFKGIIAFVLAGKKFIIPAVIGVAALGGRFWQRIRQATGDRRSVD